MSTTGTTEMFFVRMSAATSDEVAPADVEPAAEEAPPAAEEPVRAAASPATEDHALTPAGPAAEIDEGSAPGRELAEAAASSEDEAAGWDEEPDMPRVRPVPSGSIPAGASARRVVVIDDGDVPRGRRPSSGLEGAEASEDEGVAPIGATLRDEDAPKRRWRLFRKGGEG